MTRYYEIGGGYSYAVCRSGGVAVRNAAGAEIFAQPGDDAKAMHDNIAALDEISEDISDAKRGTIADMILGEYFA
jgi:hypothetical protein